MTKFELTPFDMLLLNTPPKFLKDETKKIRKSIKNKKWRSENAEKIKQQGIQYRIKNAEKIKEKDLKYREKNRKRESERKKKWREENPERAKESDKNYRENNPEKIKESQKKFILNNPENHKKSNKKKSWKQLGLNMEHFEEIYEIYMITTHCDICEVELTEGKKMTKTTKCMDHSHITGEFRNIVCCSCNCSLPEGT